MKIEITRDNEFRWRRNKVFEKGRKFDLIECRRRRRETIGSQYGESGIPIEAIVRRTHKDSKEEKRGREIVVIFK